MDRKTEILLLLTLLVNGGLAYYNVTQEYCKLSAAKTIKNAKLSAENAQTKALRLQF